ncbi:MAG: hypothetical protein QY332_10080 [Anaerolineales bacterium]|nr:MAG: hypothetical protein QY332_10080 [Anaerolineales bacterium]
MTMLNYFLQAAAFMFRFLLELALGILVAILYIIPWFLRAATVLGWLAAAFLCLTTLRRIYSPFTDAVPMLALEFLVIMLALLWAMAGMLAGKHVWGVLAAGALTLWGVSSGMTWLSINWQHADLFFRVLPPVLLAVGMITLSIRTRARRLSAHGMREPSAAEVSA